MILSKVVKRKSILIFLVLVTVCILVVLMYILLQVNYIQAKLSSQEMRYNDLSSRMSAIKYSPGSLSDCINVATLEYSNFIKTKGVISQVAGREPAYSLSEHEWKKADDKLKSDRVACESQFGIGK